MKIFLDANILVSVLNKEYPLFIYSSRILSLVGQRKFEIYTSPICLAIAFYFAEKKSGSVQAKKKIELLIQNINVSSVDFKTVRDAIQNKRINDFEDGLEYYSASKAKCKCIVTEDVNDFYFGSLEVLNAMKFLEKYVL